MNTSKQLNDALTAHRKWRARLKQAVESGTSEFRPGVVKLDNQCDFGKWLYYRITPEDQQSPHYQSIKQLHARFHLEAAKILEAALQGRKHEAERAFSSAGEFAQTSAALISELTVWRLEKSDSQMSGEKAISTDKMKTILEERARALTRSTEVQAGESMQLVVFSLANETYGIATDYVREVQPLRQVSPVPCTPDFVVGVINIRGSIYSVIDIRGFFGVAQKEITDLTKVILVNAAGLEVGILADDVKGATSIPLSEIKAALAAQAASRDEYIQGVTKDMLIILNLEALLRDERIIVHQEVG
jgi:purine-binding chemotaxis protein CheW